MNNMIGKKFRLTRSFPTISAYVGDICYVFNQYRDFDDSQGIGIQVIFPSGGYDGFSVNEQKLYLEFVEDCPQYAGYEFHNVSEVARDFRKRYWKF